MLGFGKIPERRGPGAGKVNKREDGYVPARACDGVFVLAFLGEGG